MSETENGRSYPHAPGADPIKSRRHIRIDAQLDQYLDKVENPNDLIQSLLYAHRAYQDTLRAVEYVDEKRSQERAAETAQNRR